MNEEMRRLEPGRLWPLVLERTHEALRTGALQPINTVSERFEQDGVNFIIRTVSSLPRKFAESRPENPFLPLDPALFVANISATHACVLNKYNVIDNHLLFVTRHFEEQELPLTGNDLTVMLRVLEQVDGLVFYNSGRAAGASQPHRHLQLVPLPLVPEDRLPMSAVIRAILRRDDRWAPLPFRHAVTPVSQQWFDDPARSASALKACYVRLLLKTGVTGSDSIDPGEPLAPYNLLMTRNWMLLVPRSREHFQGISINALGFAGSLFVGNREKLNSITGYGPMNVLRDVSVPLQEP